MNAIARIALSLVMVAACGVCVAYAKTSVNDKPLQGYVAKHDEDAYKKGLKFYQERNYQEALDYFILAEQEKPDSANIKYYLANTLVKVGRKDDGIDLYRYLSQNFKRTRAGRLSKVALNRLKASEVRRKGGYVSSISHGDAYVRYQPRNLPRDYMNVLPNPSLRWDPADMPIRIYVADRRERGSYVHYEDMIPKAMNEWVAASKGRISYTFIKDPTDADITISWVQVIGGNTKATREKDSHEIGLTYLRYHPTTKYLFPVQVEFAVRDFSTNQPYSKKAMYTTMLHEFGHALGIQGHSNYALDIMSTVAHSRATLSPRDKATILKKYRDY